MIRIIIIHTDKFLRKSFNLELDCRNAGSTNIKIPSM